MLVFSLLYQNGPGAMASSDFFFFNTIPLLLPTIGTQYFINKIEI